jgi:ribonuclease Z
MKTYTKEIKIGEFIITGYSRALVSSWMGFPQFGVMFDCGDGIASRLGSSLGTYKYLALTHAHMDHITGLSQVLNLRNRLNPELKTTVFYPPQAQNRVDAQKSMLGERVLSSIIEQRIDPENPSPIDIGGNRTLSWFPTKHSGTGQGSSVGYVIKSKKKTRKPEYASLSKEEILKLVESGVQVSEDMMRPTVAYIGDSPAIDEDIVSAISGVDLLVMEGTIINLEDFESEERIVHSTIAETISGAIRVGPKNLVINHLSPRYHDAYATSQIESITSSFSDQGIAINFGVHRLAGDDLFTIQ